jgi:hypothetical protein
LATIIEMNKVLNIIIFGGLLILLVIALMPIFGQGIFGRTISYGLGLGDAFYALMSFVAFVVFMILINLKKIKSNLKSKRTVAIFIYLTIIFFSYSFTVGRGVEYAWNGEILYPSTQGQEKNNDYKSSTLELGNGDDVIVNLEVLDNTGITKIEFQANGNVEAINSDDLENYKIVSFGFEGKGEGTFKVCVYSSSDAICSEHYVEGGYRPELTCTKEKIEVKEHIGY